MTSPIQNVVILGASSAGLLTAVALKHYFPQLHISLLYSRKHAPIGVGESTTAWVPEFLHKHLEIPREEFYPAVWPVWKLGIRFEWGHPDVSHFNYTFDHQFAYDVRQLSHSPGFFCMHDMQDASRFSVLMNKGHAPIWTDQENKTHAIFDSFGYHFGVDELLAFLFQKVSGLGIDIKQLEVLGAEQDTQGNIQHLICENDIKISGDLFIDCSGFKSKLLGEILEEDFISFSDRLFCDTAITSSPKRQSPILPFTTVTTMNSGWRWRIDLRDRISYGYVYSSQFCDQEQAIQEFIEQTPGIAPDVKTIKFRSGRYQRFWRNNVIALGNASGFVEPLESTGQHMIAETLLQVINALKDSHRCPTPKLISTVNTYIGELWDEISDFLALHFKFNRKLNTPFWKHCRAETPLRQAQALVDLYQDSGVCHAMAHLISQSSVFEADGYLTILCGQKLPVKNLPAITSSQQQEWNQYRKFLRKTLKSSFNPEKAFNFLEQYYASPKT